MVTRGEETGLITANGWQAEGVHGPMAARTWPHESPRYVALLAHGYGEHAGRYEHVARALVAHGATVYGIDHLGHGESPGERVLITDFADVVADLHTVAGRARENHPGLPVVLIGHSMGGMIAARYAQLHGAGLAALVLSGPMLGRPAALQMLSELDEIPDIPIDPDILSRDLMVGAAYAEDPLVWHGPFKRPTVEAMLRCLAEIEEAGPLGAVPTLWLHGGDDMLVPEAETRAGIEKLRGAGLTEKIYPGARHEIFNETDKDAVLADVTAFLDRVL